MIGFIIIAQMLLLAPLGFAMPISHGYAGINRPPGGGGGGTPPRGHPQVTRTGLGGGYQVGGPAYPGAAPVGYGQPTNYGPPPAYGPPPGFSSPSYEPREPGMGYDPESAPAGPPPVQYGYEGEGYGNHLPGQSPLQARIDYGFPAGGGGGRRGESYGPGYGSYGPQPRLGYQQGYPQRSPSSGYNKPGPAPGYNGGQPRPGHNGRDPSPGYNGRDQGYNGRDQSYNGRDQGYNGRDQSYNGRDQGYNGRDQGYNGRDQGYNGRDQGYNGRDQGFNGRDQGYNGRDQSYNEGSGFGGGNTQASEYGSKSSFPSGVGPSASQGREERHGYNPRVQVAYPRSEQIRYGPETNSGTTRNAYGSSPQQGYGGDGRPDDFGPGSSYGNPGGPDNALSAQLSSGVKVAVYDSRSNGNDRDRENNRNGYATSTTKDPFGFDDDPFFADDDKSSSRDIRYGFGNQDDRKSSSGYRAPSFGRDSKPGYATSERDDESRRAGYGPSKPESRSYGDDFPNFEDGFIAPKPLNARRNPGYGRDDDDSRRDGEGSREKERFGYEAKPTRYGSGDESSSRFDPSSRRDPGGYGVALPGERSPSGYGSSEGRETRERDAGSRNPFATDPFFKDDEADTKNAYGQSRDGDSKRRFESPSREDEFRPTYVPPKDRSRSEPEDRFGPRPGSPEFRPTYVPPEDRSRSEPEDRFGPSSGPGSREFRPDTRDSFGAPRTTSYAPPTRSTINPYAKHGYAADKTPNSGPGSRGTSLGYGRYLANF